MASGQHNALLEGMRGRIGELVIKQYKGKIVITKVPDMSRVKPNALQKENRKEFGKAVAYAKDISRHPLKRKAYLKKVKNGQSVYHYAIQEYYRLKKK